jgi:hypothetical protein
MEDNHSFFLGKSGVASQSLAQHLFIYLVQLEYQMDILDFGFCQALGFAISKCLYIG